MYDLSCDSREEEEARGRVEMVSVDEKNEEVLLNDIEHHYSRQRDRLTRMFLVGVRREYRKNLNGVCCVCLGPIRLGACVKKVRYLGLSLSRYRNHQNPRRSDVVQM